MVGPRYLDLIAYKTYADLRAESERTYIGFLWWIIEPIISMVIYYLVFGLILTTEIADFVPFLFIGLIPWRWLSSSVGHAGNSLLASRGLMQLVYLPKILFPVISVLTDTVKFFFVFLVLLVFLWIYGAPVGLPYLSLPLILIVHFLLIAAASVLVAAVVPFLPDLRHFVDHALRLLFFVSGVFWSISAVSNDDHRFWLRLNPMAALIEAYRDVLLYDQWPRGSYLAGIAVFALLGLYGGVRLIARNNWVYPKLV
jgi:lipopolysaccharide transport system permease protein